MGTRGEGFRLDRLDGSEAWGKEGLGGLLVAGQCGCLLEHLEW